MKNISTTLFIFMCLFVITTSNAQNDKKESKHEVPEEVLLNTLNNVNSMKKLSNDTILKLMEYNKGYVSKVYGIMNSTDSKGDKNNAFKKLSAENEKNLIAIFGKKGIYNDYVKLMENQLEPLIKKNSELKNLY